MNDVPQINPDDQLLTVDQAYVAAYGFVRQFYERDGRKPESMFHLLRWMKLERPRQSDDPAQWFDWVASVERALAPSAEERCSEPISPPLSS